MFKMTQNKVFLSPILLVLLFLAVVFLPQQAATAEDENVIDIDFSAGLNVEYHSVPVLVGDDEVANTLEFTYLALQVDVGLLDFLTVGVVAGFNSNLFKDPLDFTRLPLSLSTDGERFNSMMFGVRAKSDLLTWGSFSLVANGEILLFKRFTKELPIVLDIVSGTGTLKNSFQQLALELLVQYDGFSGMSIFAGPQLNLINGKMTASELIGNIDAQDELSFHQEKVIGLTAGIYYELGGNLDICAKISLFSQTSLSVTLFYVF
jgi:hypothetical protein